MYIGVYVWCVQLAAKLKYQVGDRMWNGLCVSSAVTTQAHLIDARPGKAQFLRCVECMCNSKTSFLSSNTATLI